MYRSMLFSITETDKLSCPANHGCSSLPFPEFELKSLHQKIEKLRYIAVGCSRLQKGINSCCPAPNALVLSYLRVDFMQYISVLCTQLQEQINSRCRAENDILLLPG
ncbi:MAG: hypothetical protein JWP69_1622 [Flaviaesturariibacter sp.]|nr:hypothetical protein [Flaviaesturariibacter sp.]